VEALPSRKRALRRRIPSASSFATARLMLFFGRRVCLTISWAVVAPVIDIQLITAASSRSSRYFRSSSCIQGKEVAVADDR
jgi:hypothetical protein